MEMNVFIQLKNLGVKKPSRISLLKDYVPHPDALEILCNVNYKNNQILKVKFEEDVIGISPGQYMAIFIDDECIGSGKIYCDHVSKFKK